MILVVLFVVYVLIRVLTAQLLQQRARLALQQELSRPTPAPATQDFMIAALQLAVLAFIHA